MIYKAHFQGGPKHGDVDPTSRVAKIYTVATVYDTAGFRTVSKYNLVDQKGDELYYNLDEERFDGVDPTPFQRRSK